MIPTKKNTAFSKTPSNYHTSKRFQAVGHAAALCVAALLVISPASAETLVIPGSGNPEFILKELANAYNSQQAQHRVVVPTTIGTAGALREVTEGRATMGRVGRPLKGKELELGLTYHPLGRDPVAFVAGAGASVSNISTQQTIDIFTGKIGNWRDLGGKPAAIRAIGREPTDASRQSIMKEIKAFADLQYHSSVKIVLLDTQLIDLLDRFPTSFGFLNRSAISAATTKLTALKLDSVEPDAENVKAGRYRIWTELGLIYRSSSLTDAGRSFLDFIESPRGNELLRAHGVLPADTRPAGR